MKYIYILIAVSLASSASAEDEKIVVKSADGMEQVFNISNNDPSKAPRLYAGLLYMNNIGFTGASKTTAGLGADIKYYWKDRTRLHAYYAQGFFNHTATAKGFMNIEADVSYYFRSVQSLREVSIRMRSGWKEQGKAFSIPANLSGRMGVRLGFNRHNIPLTAMARIDGNTIRFTSASSFVTAAGFTLTKIHNMNITSVEYGDKRVSSVRSLYADMLYAPKNDMAFYVSRYPAEGSVQADNAEPEEIRLGMRIGYEWTSLCRWSRTGAFYRLEAGCRPGFKGYSSGAYIRFNAGLDLGW